MSRLCCRFNLKIVYQFFDILHRRHIICSNSVHTVASVSAKLRRNHCRILALVRLRFPMSDSHCIIFRLQFFFFFRSKAQIQDAHKQEFASATSLSARVLHKINHSIGAQPTSGNFLFAKNTKSKRSRRSLLSSTYVHKLFLFCVGQASVRVQCA